MNDKKNFQLIVIGICMFLAVGGVATFVILGKSGNNTTGPQAEITMWGLESADSIGALVEKINLRSASPLKLIYEEKKAENFDQDLIEALASGVGPDVVLIPEDRLLRHKDKFYEIPFETFPERLYKDTFPEIGEVFLTDIGLSAVPFSIDPMVMYWNRELFSNAGLSEAPKYWDEFFLKFLPLTYLDEKRNVVRSSIAMGEYDNINNAKEILSTLLMQSGDRIVETKNGQTKVVLGDRVSGGSSPAESALRFFTEFSNPTKEVYSWNRSLSNSRSAFLAGDLAVYFGFASEASVLMEKNPNLNFDVALMPQIRDASRVVFGRVSALAILKSSRYISDSYLTINLLTGAESQADWASASNLPPVNRSLLSSKPTDATLAVFYESAVIAKTWLAPDTLKSADVFKQMIGNVTSGKLRISEAVARARDQLEATLR